MLYRFFYIIESMEFTFFFNLFVIIIFIIICYKFDPLFAVQVSYCDFVTNDLNNYVVPRTPLLSPGQKISDLADGYYRVTGGTVKVGLGPNNGAKSRIIGIIVDGSQNFAYLSSIGNIGVSKVTGLNMDDSPAIRTFYDYNHMYIDYNRNFAYVLYELREAGMTTFSKINADEFEYPLLQKVATGPNMHYLRTNVQVTNPSLTLPEDKTFSITDKLINNLGGKSEWKKIWEDEQNR